MCKVFINNQVCDVEYIKVADISTSYHIVRYNKETYAIHIKNFISKPPTNAKSIIKNMPR